MDRLLEFSQKSSELSQDFFPPLVLNPHSNYVLGLYCLTTYNSISNIKENVNNSIGFAEIIPSNNVPGQQIRISPGKYELSRFTSFIKQYLPTRGIDFELIFDNEKNKIKIKSNYEIIDLRGGLLQQLGFKSKSLPPGENISSEIAVVFKEVPPSEALSVSDDKTLVQPAEKRTKLVAEVSKSSSNSKEIPNSNNKEATIVKKPAAPTLVKELPSLTITEGSNDEISFQPPPPLKRVKPIRIQPGSYEIAQLGEYLTRVSKEVGIDYKLAINPSTMKVEMKSSHEIIFPTNSIRGILGFKKDSYPANVNNISESIPTISTINVINVECSIVDGSFRNGKKSHSLYSFTPDVPIGYKLIERPKNMLFLPVHEQEISNITLRLTDQSGNLVFFNNEEVTIHLVLREL